jgi:ABC-type multidrug transport system fused ATPase/permease subunit
VQQSLNVLMKRLTVLVIAHRLSTIRQANRIVVIEGGRIAEMGSHDELIASRGVYHHLYELQHAEPNAVIG